MTTNTSAKCFDEAQIDADSNNYSFKNLLSSSILCDKTIHADHFQKWVKISIYFTQIGSQNENQLMSNVVQHGLYLL